MTDAIDAYLQVPKGTRLECILPHEDSSFTVGNVYRVSAHKHYDVPGGGLKYAGVVIRDDKRQRRDFNFIPTSKNYIWKHFKKQ